MLQTKLLTKHFGGLAAVNDLDLEVRQGEILGLIGPNGAGKTTVFNMITGFTRPTKGKIEFKGHDITGLAPNKIAALGMARIFQANTLINNRTVYENVLVAHYLQRSTSVLSSVFRTRSSLRDEDKIKQRSTELLERAGLNGVKEELASSLPHGVQRALQICMALASNPELILLDEPTAGMSVIESTNTLDLIQHLRSHGRVTFLLVEHDMRVIMGTCDRIVVLNFGEKIAEGTPVEIAENERVIEAYLGLERGD